MKLKIKINWRLHNRKRKEKDNFFAFFLKPCATLNMNWQCAFSLNKTKTKQKKKTCNVNLHYPTKAGSHETFSLFFLSIQERNKMFTKLWLSKHLDMRWQKALHDTWESKNQKLLTVSFFFFFKFLPQGTAITTPFRVKDKIL